MNGFAGDRTPEAINECHSFAQAVPEFLGSTLRLHGTVEQTNNVQWKEALIESTGVFSTTIKVIRGPTMAYRYSPRHATAIVFLLVIGSSFPDVVVIYFVCSKEEGAKIL